ncbi:hypothetical protein GCM10010306_091690 [Streptomyces umbrinus]|nr:hypothetical protein GCM10010306_091690 [Streptomyces umbrinus]
MDGVGRRTVRSAAAREPVGRCPHPDVFGALEPAEGIEHGAVHINDQTASDRSVAAFGGAKTTAAGDPSTGARRPRHLRPGARSPGRTKSSGFVESTLGRKCERSRNFVIAHSKGHAGLLLK